MLVGRGISPQAGETSTLLPLSIDSSLCHFELGRYESHNTSQPIDESYLNSVL